MRTVDPVSDVVGSDRPHGHARRATGGDRPRRGFHALTDVIDVSDGWEFAARCREHDATLFFGPNRFEPKHERLEREAEAKAICAGCPVLSSCRDHAMRGGELYGVWGGLGESDRRALLAPDQRVGRGVARAV